MTGLFTPVTLRSVTFPNRAWVSPMCQYSARDGIVGDWHLVHLGAFAAGGAGLVMTEATGVVPEGRISPQCPGLWTEEQAVAWSRIVDYLHAQGARVGMQLAHAGRKASVAQPWTGGAHVEPKDGGWTALAPSAVGFGTLPAPAEMNADDIRRTIRGFALATRRAVDAGFDALEIHAAHGYLIHQFLSPLSNLRTDEYGGALDNRMRLALEVAEAVREAWPDDLPLMARISTTDWMPGGWDLEQSVVLSEHLRDRGVDLIDASSGGLDARAVVPDTVTYQTDLAAELRRRTGMPVAAVGRITSPSQAQNLIATGAADAVFIARQFLRDPHWPLRAAHELGESILWRPQYLRAAVWES